LPLRRTAVCSGKWREMSVWSIESPAQGYDSKVTPE
jgi:hypothetical protein